MEATEKTVENEDATENRLKNSFTQSGIDILWKEYLDELKKSENKIIFNALHHVKIKLKEHFNIVFEVTSKATQEEFNRQRNVLLRMFKDRLKNDFITFETEIIEIESGKILYNPKEKYEYLVKKNPNLETLRKNLDLDIYG